MPTRRSSTDPSRCPTRKGLGRFRTLTELDPFGMVETLSQRATLVSSTKDSGDSMTVDLWTPAETDTKVKSSTSTSSW